MPEWYKKILQRPGQETQLITERPSKFYQLELPDFKIPTVTNSKDSVITGLENRKWRDIWEHKGRASGINNTDGFLQQEHPSLFLLPFAPEIMGSGLGLGVLKTLGGYAGSYVGSKIGNEVGYALDNTFNKQLFKPLGEIVGSFAGFGKGYNLFEKAGMQGALKYLSNTGKEIPRWFMRPELRTNVGRINQRTFFAEDQTPKYNSNQLPGLNRRLYQSPSASKLEMIPRAAFASESKNIIPTNPKKFASRITLQENVPVNDDIAKIATAIANPGTFSSMAQYGLDKSKEIFTSPWMRTRLHNMGYSDSEIKNYIQDRLKQMDTSKLSIADDLENVHELTAFKNGNIRIGEADPVLIGENYNLLNISPFNQAIIQATKRGDVVGTIQHEIAGHGTEFPGFKVDKNGNLIYDGVKLTDSGIQATVDKKLDDEYYIDAEEQRARYLPVAQQMYDTGFDPNSESDFYNFLEFHKSDPETTQAGQLAKYYNWKSIWPAFSKARALIPFGLIGLSQIPQNNKNQKQ